MRCECVKEHVQQERSVVTVLGSPWYISKQNRPSNSHFSSYIFDLTYCFRHYVNF